MAKEAKTIQINIRVTPTLKAAMDRAATADHRTLASLFEKVMIEHLRASGYLKKPRAE
jgi:hypothetical protein